MAPSCRSTVCWRQLVEKCGGVEHSRFGREERCVFFGGYLFRRSIVSDTIEEIREEGLKPGREQWKIVYDRPGDIDSLFRKPDLSTNDTRHRDDCVAISACGEKEGAIYYACKHNISRENDTPIVIEFTADEKFVAVDGRDFLYSIFQSRVSQHIRDIVKKAYGKKALRYANKAWNSSNQKFRIAQCDLAVYDAAVIRAHYANEIILGGRYGTVFRSAFLIGSRVHSTNILNAWSPSIATTIPKPEIRLKNLVAFS